MTRHPGFIRACAECREYLVGENGEVSMRRARGRRPGEVIELPMLRSEVGIPPPCGTCPKIPARDARTGEPLARHWSNAVEFEPWYFACRDWFEECKAVGDFGPLTPVMRAVARLFHNRDEARRAADHGAVTALLASLTRRK